MRYLLSLLFTVILSTIALAHPIHSLAPFQEIVATGNLEIWLEQGETESIRVEEDLFKIIVEEDGPTLRVKRHKPLDFKQYDGKPIKVYITYKKLREIKGLAGAEFYSEEVLNGDYLRIRLGSGAESELNVAYKSVDIYLTEGAVLAIEGEVEDMEAHVATGAELEADDLVSKRTYAKATTGGIAEVNATEYLDAKATLGGSVDYSGQPDKLRVKDYLGGEIHPR